MFEGKIAVVTGAARGIGQAIAYKLAAKGADLVLCDIKAEWLTETAEGVEKLGRKASCFELDVTDAAAVQNVFNDIAAQTGRIDILINNAGITRDGLLMRMSEEDWDAVLTVNLKGTFACTKAVSRIDEAAFRRYRQRCVNYWHYGQCGTSELRSIKRRRYRVYQICC